MNIFVTVSGNQNSWIGFDKMDVGFEFWVVGFHNVRRCSTAAVRDQLPSTSFPHVSHLWCGRYFMDYLGLKQNNGKFFQIMWKCCPRFFHVEVCKKGITGVTCKTTRQLLCCVRWRPFQMVLHQDILAVWLEYQRPDTKTKTGENGAKVSNILWGLINSLG